MTVREQQEQSKMEPYAEAMRFMRNAEETLRKTRKENGFFLDGKYVSGACGIAYKGVLHAMDAWLVTKGKPMLTKRDQTKKHRDINMYRAEVTKLDGRMLNLLNSVYNLLHLAGYYDEELDARAIQSGFEHAYEIIARIKPDVPEEELQQYIEAHTKKKSTLWGQLSSFMLF